MNEFHHDSLCFITFYQSDPFNMLGEGDRIQKVPEFRAGDSGDSEFSAPGWLVDSLFFPTCQLRVSRFYQSCLLLLPFLLPSSFLPRIATASSRSQWALPDLNRELQISVGTAGPRPRAPDLSGHGRAVPTPENARIDDRKNVKIDAREIQRERQHKCQKVCQIECQKECESICQKEGQIEWLCIYIYPI